MAGLNNVLSPNKNINLKKQKIITILQIEKLNYIIIMYMYTIIIIPIIIHFNS